MHAPEMRHDSAREKVYVPCWWLRVLYSRDSQEITIQIKKYNTVSLLEVCYSLEYLNPPISFDLDDAVVGFCSRLLRSVGFWSAVFVWICVDFLHRQGVLLVGLVLAVHCSAFDPYSVLCLAVYQSRLLE
jgi:hypothetical protein